MKPQKFSKKLSLNKKTIVHLDNGESKKAAAGRPECQYATWGAGSCDTVCHTEWSGEDDKSVVICCAGWVCS
jgi:hypothetical protein